VNVDRIVAVAHQVAGAAPETADRVVLGDLSRMVSQLRAVCDALDARIARRATELAAAGGCEPAEAVVALQGRRPLGEARAAVRRGEACARHHGLAAALGDGEISGGHVDAVARARHGLDEAARAVFDAAVDALVDDAKVMAVDAFARRCNTAARRAAADAGVARQERLRRQRCISRWVDADTGMCITRIALDPLTDAEMWTAINAAVRATQADLDQHNIAAPAWGQLAADVTVGLITGARTVPPRTPEVSVHIDWDTLRDEAAAAGIVCELDDGTPLPPATVRRLCCDADLVPVGLGGDGAVLDVGRARRLATCDQRRALAAMYSRCGLPGCHVAVGHCRIHHVTDWTNGGATDVDKQIPHKIVSTVTPSAIGGDGRMTLRRWHRPSRPRTVTRRPLIGDRHLERRLHTVMGTAFQMARSPTSSTRSPSCAASWPRCATPWPSRCAPAG
jgi:hypothetical protein